MAQIYLGVMIAGLILTMKIVMDSLRVIGRVNIEIGHLRTSTQTCIGQIDTEKQRGAELALQVSQIQAEVKELIQKEKDMNDQIRELRNELDSGPKLKGDM